MDVSSRSGRLLAAVAVVTVALCVEGATAGTDDFDGIQMKGLVDEMIRVGVFDDSTQIAVDVSCAGKSLAECYAALNTEYTNKVAPKIVKSFHSKLVELMKEYNIAAKKYANYISTKSGKNVDQEDLSVIAFPDSEMHCVLGLIDLHQYADTPTAELLADHIIYNQLANVPNIQLKDKFNSYLSGFFQMRSYTDTTSEKNASRIVALKMQINNFSKPFCGLQQQRGLKWVSGNAFASAKLRGSIQLAQMVIDGGTIFNRSVIPTEANKTVQYILDSMWDYNKKEDLHNFRHKVSDLMDKYVTKILTPKLIEVTINAMQLYYNNIKGLDTSKPEEKATYENNYNKHHYLKSLIMSFKTLLLYYVDVEPITISRDTSDFLINTIQMLVDSIERQQFAENEKNDPNPTITKLKGAESDSKLKGVSAPGNKDDLSTIDACIVLTEKVISSLAYMTEAKVEN